ncbi:MAG: hypothetical protein R3192_12995 [Woeseiaceae bacterium]|nr:hypothetical protein [Woeseiaceae bacterium]
MSSTRPYLSCIAALLLLAVAACATNESGKGNDVFADTPPKDEIVCRRVRPVGSHVPVEVCRTTAQSEEDQRRALDAIGPLRPMGGDLPPPPPPSTNPN